MLFSRDLSGRAASGVRAAGWDKAWDFKTREAFVAFARDTFVEGTQRLPESAWEAFISDVLEPLAVRGGEQLAGSKFSGATRWKSS